MRITSSLAVLSSFLIFAQVGCTIKETKYIERQAPEQIQESFGKLNLNASDELKKSCEQLSCLTIQKASLGKIFLLIASGKTAGSTPQWYDLKPLVVSFERSGQKIALLGENYTSIYEEIKTVNLIQSFDVVGEDESSITFDWNKGLQTFVLQSSYDVDGARGTNNDLTESSFQSIPVIDSFIRDIKFDDKNLELEQISKVRMDVIKPASDKVLNVENREETLAMNIQIRSYNLSSDFKPKEYDSSRRVGFFVTKVGKKGMSADVSNLITKWDISDAKGPIKVRLSSAVPEEYLGAVKEGALYWNHVFGKEVLEVVVGEDPQAAPKDRSITLRWIPWLDSGAAYAIGQSDPLTGELLRAQVFMPSVFTRVGSAELVKMNGDAPVVGAVACDFSHRVQKLEELMREADHSQRLRLAQDAVRATVAHELGHALGLRHNFAGSFSAKVSAQQVEKEASRYLKNTMHKGLETSTSIMDYVSGVDEALMSARLKTASLSYDKMAMDWAYAEAADQGLDEKVSLYCTDDDIALAGSQKLQIYGCERFDAGNNPMLRKVLDMKREKESFVKVLFASIIGRTYPGDKPEVKLPLQAVLADSLKWGQLNTKDLDFVHQFIFDHSANGAPNPQFASLANVKTGQILYSKFGLDMNLGLERAKSLAEAGGYAQIIDSLWRDSKGEISTHWLEDQIAELRDAAYLASGTTLSGRDYQLSQEEQEMVLAFFENLVKMNKDALEAGLSALLPKVEVIEATNSGSRKVSAILPEGLLTEEGSQKVLALYLDLLAAGSGTIKAQVGEGLSKEVELIKPFLALDKQKKWYGLLSSQGLRFNMELKKAQVKGLKLAKIQNFLILVGVDPSLAQSEGFLVQKLQQQGLIDATAAAWLTQEMELLKAL